MTYSAKIIAGGKIVIPAELRRELGLNTGDTLMIEREDGKLVLKSYLQVVREVQAQVRERAVPYEGSVVDALIAERRQEAAREEAEDGTWREAPTPK
jgi:AbrB family transcriptional regulator, stage V sporulation protein T